MRLKIETRHAQWGVPHMNRRRQQGCFRLNFIKDYFFDFFLKCRRDHEAQSLELTRCAGQVTSINQHRRQLPVSGKLTVRDPEKDRGALLLQFCLNEVKKDLSFFRIFQGLQKYSKKFLKQYTVSIKYY